MIEKTSSDHQSHAHSFALTALSSGVGVAATLVSGILLARLLSVEDRGLVALVIYWASFAASIGSLSLHEAFVLRASQTKTAIDERLPSALAVAAALLIATIALTSLALAIFDEQFADLEMRWLVLFIASFLFLRSLNATLVAVEQSNLRFGRLALEQMLLPLCYSALLIIAGFTGYLTVTVALAIFLISRTPLLVIRVWRYRHMMMRPVRFSEIVAIATIGARFHSTNLLRSIADQADKIVISLQWGANAVANFAVAFSAAGAAYGLVGQALGLISLPVASKVPEAEMADHFTRSFRVTSILLVAIAIPIVSLAPILIPFVFGSKYDSAVLYTQVLTLALLPVPLIGLTDAMLRGRGHTGPAMRLQVATLILFAIGWGATGYSEIVSLGLGLAGSRVGALIYTILLLRNDLARVRLVDCLRWRREDVRLILATAHGLVSVRRHGKG